MTVKTADLETGDLSQFDVVTDTEGDLLVNAGAARHGGYGLEAVIDNTTTMSARLASLEDGDVGKSVWGRCYFKVDAAFTQANSTDTTIFFVTNDLGTGALIYLYRTSTGSKT